MMQTSTYEERFAKAMAKAEAKAVANAVLDTARDILATTATELNSDYYKAIVPNYSGAIETAAGRIINLATALGQAGEELMKRHYKLNKLYNE